MTNGTDPELSGIAKFSQLDHFADVRSRGDIAEVPTISLDDLLDKFSAPQIIDYMSIDTEGSELNILSSYSFRHKFKLITIENNKKNEAALDELLSSQGYIRVFREFSQWDSWYVARDLRRPRSSSSLPQMHDTRNFQLKARSESWPVLITDSQGFLRMIALVLGKAFSGRLERFPLM